MTRFRFPYGTTPNAFNQLTKVTGSDGATTGFGYDGNGNQVTKVERPAGSAARTWTYGYDLDDRLVNVSNHSEVPAPTQWASGATASSSLFPNGAAAATGAPDTNVCGSTATAWAPMPMPWSGSEWLQASYATAVKAKGVRIHESSGAPFVKQVELVEPGGTRHTVWSGQDATACGAWLNVDFDGTSYPVAGVKVTTAASMNLGLDAVGLDPVPAAGPETQVAAYQYDANGLRVRRVDSGGDRAFLLDGLSIAAEYSAPGVKEAWYTQSLARIDEPLSVVTSQGKYWYQADALGSIYTLTTSTGAVQARGGYDVFGAPAAEGGAAVGQRFGFTGREHEPDSGLVYARARYLQPGAGRWDRADPAGMVDGPNLYAYVNAGPTQRTDPGGLSWWFSIGLFLAWVAGEGPDWEWFGPGTDQVQDLQLSPGVNEARKLFFELNCGARAINWAPIRYPYKFGLKGLLDAGLNSTQQFVGSYVVEVVPLADGRQLYIVSNTTSFTSFLYGLGPNWERTQARYMGNIRQVFWWTEPDSFRPTR